MKQICVIGTGYVGLVNGTGFAELGNNVVTVDIDAKKVEALKAGKMPIYEPGLEELVERNVQAGRLHFTTSYEEGLKEAEFVFICVGTPEGVDGEADLKYVRAAAETIAKTMTHPLIIINKSTVPVGTGDWVADIIRNTQPKPIPFSVVSCPEFLREGAAINDFMHPDRTVLGSLDKRASEAVAQLYLPLRAPIMMTDLRTAEMIKYASNAFLATRISFINEISIICEKLGADVIEVAQGMGFDKRIGHHFLQAGVGYGGSCFEGDETIFVLDEDGFVNAQPLRAFFEDVTDEHIEVVKPQGKRVLSFNLETGCPEVADVLVATRRPYQGDMVTIKTSMGREIRVTHDHPVIRLTDNGFERVLADDIRPDDSIMMLKMLPDLASVPSQLNINGEIIPIDAHLMNHVGGYLAGANVSARFQQILDVIGCDGQSLPHFALNLSPDLRYELLRGMGLTAQFEFFTPHKLLAHSLVLLMQSLNMIPSLSTNETGYRIQWDGAQTRHGEAFAITHVLDIQRETVDQMVYSLKTPLDTVITAGGTIIGQCFPKDVSALSYMAQTHGMHPQLLNAVMEINAFQRKHVALKLHDLLHDVAGKTIGFWGLAFKENTDDIRESPALAIISMLMEQGAKIRAYDPVAMPNTAQEMPDIVMCKNPYDVADGADAVVVATPWNEFKQIDMERVIKLMKQPIMVDGRNMYEPTKMRELGFVYRAVGRGYNGEGIG